ncbi:MAG: hypothetical protein NT075_02195 [Chloroflexi bacterium]|nr:hypothetical protein [Chloroflexota bacterium]
MVKTPLDAPTNVVERNILLTSEIMRYLLEQPELFSALPSDFELVILPEDDPEMRLYNLDLLDKYGSQGKPIVFARTKARPSNGATKIRPSLFVPVPVAV